MDRHKILRVFLNPGHGRSNIHPGKFDPGATSQFGGEHGIVQRIVDATVDAFYFDPSATVEVIETPECSDDCAFRHPFKRNPKSALVMRDHRKQPLRSGHLTYTVQWINWNTIRDAKGEFRDFVLSVHMNASDNPQATGVEVLYSDQAPQRKALAAAVSKAVAQSLELPDRGAKTDLAASGKRLPILGDTRPPALLIEMGFVTNGDDVLAVKEYGVAALKAAIATIQKEVV